MTTKSAKNTTAAEPANEAFQDALKFYEQAIKSGIQLQEESIKVWKEVLERVGTPEELRQKLEELANEVLPQTQKRMDSMASIFKENANQCSELFSKTLGLYQATSPSEGQERLQDLVETSLTALRNNVHAAVDTNAQILKTWDQMFGKR